LFRVWRALLRNKMGLVLPASIADFEQDITIEDFT